MPIHDYRKLAPGLDDKKELTGDSMNTPALHTEPARVPSASDDSGEPEIVTWQYRELGKTRWQYASEDTLERIRTRFPTLYEVRGFVPFDLLTEARNQLADFRKVFVERKQQLVDLTKLRDVLQARLNAVSELAKEMENTDSVMGQAYWLKQLRARMGLE